MINAIKSELRKILTVRTTYIILAISFGLTAFASYTSGSSAIEASVSDPSFLRTNVSEVIMIIGIIPALIGLLVCVHEYRFGTMSYTLTATPNRLTVILSKIVATTLLVIPVALIMSLVSPLFVSFGVGSGLSGQDFSYGSFLLRTFFTIWGYSMFGMILAAIIRNQAGAISAFFVLPLFGELLLGRLVDIVGLKPEYLPFTQLATVMDPNSPGNPVLVTLIYVVVLWVVSWVLFTKRDLT